jgi:hypothetical protein
MCVSVNRIRGVAMWLAAEGGDPCPCLKDWTWTKWRRDKQLPSITDQKIAEWNAANPADDAGSGR